MIKLKIRETKRKKDILIFIRKHETLLRIYTSNVECLDDSVILSLQTL